MTVMPPVGDPLHVYKSKRNFALTPEPEPEPTPGLASGSDALRFVVQKHWASSLHYDFRLELDGTMNSWAVPKGPSFDPSVKRMAVQVEDHPLPYADFEGTVPAKQYGAGKVIVWDAGTWTPLHDPQQGVLDGNLKFELHGHKLRGRWVLVFTLLETPYYLEPIGKGEKVYALLRESMFEAGVIGIARVVMHTKERLAALIPTGAALVLNTIRWAGEIRPLTELRLPAEGKSAAGMKPAKLKMAAQLIGDMTGPWKSSDYSDKFSDAIPALVSKKVEAGETTTGTTLEDAPSQAGASNVVDLTELLAKSLARRKPGRNVNDGNGGDPATTATVTAKKRAVRAASVVKGA